MMARAGAAYAAIVLSIVGINVPTGDVTAPKKVAESPSSSPAGSTDETPNFPA